MQQHPLPLTRRSDEQPAVHSTSHESRTIVVFFPACPFCKGSGRLNPLTDDDACEACDGLGRPPHFAEPAAPYRPPVSLGRVVATPGALGLASRHGVDLRALLRRHEAGDWGDVGVSDARANEHACRSGGRLLSAYSTPGGRVWVITEADRSATTVLLPSEY